MSSRVFDPMNYPGLAPLIPNAIDTPSITSNWNTLQGIINKEGPNGPMQINLPDGNFSLLNTLLIGYNGVGIKGARQDLTTLGLVNSSAPVILHGVRPNYTGTGYAPGSNPSPALTDFVPNTASLLDGSVQNKIGINIRQGMHLSIGWQQWTCPLAAVTQITGNWSNLPSFTFEMAVNLTPTGPLASMNGILAAIGGIAMFPFGIFLNTGYLYFFIQTTNGQQHRITVAPPTGGFTGVLRIVLQADTIAGHMSVIVNDKFANVASPTTFVPGLQFNSDVTGAPIKFGGGSPYDTNQSSWAVFDPGFKFTLLGAQLSSGIAYTPTTLPTTDANSYWYVGQAKKVLANLPLNDDPNYIVATRMVKTNNPPSNQLGVGFMIDPGVGNPYCEMSGLILEDLTIQGGHLGHAVMTGMTLHANIKNVTIVGGAIGFGNMLLGSNYTYYISGRNYFGGRAYGIRMHYAMVRAEGILQFGQPYPFGYGAIYCTSTDFRCNDIEILGNIPALNTDIVFVDGGFVANSIMVDDEVATINVLQSIVHCQLSEAYGPATCHIGALMIASLPAQACGILLTSALSATDPAASLITPSSIIIDNINLQGGPTAKALVRAVDNRWNVRIDTSVNPPANGTPLLSTS